VYVDENPAGLPGTMTELRVPVEDADRVGDVDDPVGVAVASEENRCTVDAVAHQRDRRNPRTVGVANVYDGGSTEDGRLWMLKTPSGTMLRASELPFQLNTASLQWGE
jgi:hypothetical protein